MATVSAKIQERFKNGIKKYSKILQSAQIKGINESDTVTIITDILQDIFGYDKYEEITSEFAIKRTFCDLAIKLNDEVKILIEVKAAKLNLKDEHLKQAVDYGANSGIDWVILTNGVIWKVYKIIFQKPIKHELVYQFDLTKIDLKNKENILKLYLISKEAIIAKSNGDSLQNYHMQKQLLNKYIISQILISESTANYVKRVIKKAFPNVKPTTTEIQNIIQTEIVNGTVLAGENAQVARQKLIKALKD